MTTRKGGMGRGVDIPKHGKRRTKGAEEKDAYEKVRLILYLRWGIGSAETQRTRAQLLQRTRYQNGRTREILVTKNDEKTFQI